MQVTKKKSSTSDATQSKMEAAFTTILTEMGEDPHRHGLTDTPKRAAKAMQYLTQGYGVDIDELVKGAIFESDNQDMIVVKDIELYSICEHHLLPFLGKCHVAYLPNGNIIGLSKIARIVDVFARRLQVQERLTQQIAESLMHALQAKGVGVIIEAQHLCMTMRGVAKQNSVMKTSLMLGSFSDNSHIRSEFFHLLR
jgi:GTP cyclohydrolase I